MKRKVIILIILLIIIAIGGYQYTYKDHRDIATEKESYTITAATIFLEFQKNESAANAKYLDKTIEITGDISNIEFETKSIVINDKLFATFLDKLPKEILPNSKIKIKGRFIGYDAILEELKMDQCVLEKL